MRSRQVGRSVLIGTVTPKRNGRVPPVLLESVIASPFVARMRSWVRPSSVRLSRWCSMGALSVASPQLVTAARQVGGLGAVARAVDGSVVRRARLLAPAQPAQQVGPG